MKRVAANGMLVHGLFSRGGRVWEMRIHGRRREDGTREVGAGCGDEAEPKERVRTIGNGFGLKPFHYWTSFSN